MSIFDRLLAGERVTIETHGQRFDMTYGPAESPCLTTYHVANEASIPLSVDAARAHVEEQAKRYGWRDVDAPIAAHAEAEAPVAAIIADAVAAVEAQAPVKAAPVKIEVAKVKIAPVKAEKREPTFDVEETPTERNKKRAPKKKGKK